MNYEDIKEKSKKKQSNKNLDISTILKRNSRLMIIISSILLTLHILFVLYNWINEIISPSQGWDGLGYAIIMAFSIPIGISIFIFGLVPNLCVLGYLKGKKRYVLSLIFNGITGITYLFIELYKSIELYKINSYNEGPSVFNMIFLVVCGLLLMQTFTNIILIVLHKRNTENVKIWYHRLIIVFIILQIIIICYLIGINIRYKLISHKAKASWEELSECTYKEFEKELKDRKLLNTKYGSSSWNYIASPDISARDSNQEYRFSKGSYNDSYLLDANIDRTFPYFKYGNDFNGYLSLVEKSKKTPKYHEIGDEDCYTSWSITYINNKLYAKLNYISKKDSTKKIKKSLIVAEEPTIFIYDISHHSRNRYYDSNKTDGVIKKCSVDDFNGDFIIVNKVDAKTLNEISKKIIKQN